jgi:hypothetical protein
VIGSASAPLIGGADREGQRMGKSVRDLLLSDAARSLFRFHALRGVPPAPASYADLDALLWEGIGGAPPPNFPVAEAMGISVTSNAFALPLPLVPGRVVYGLAVRYIGGDGPVYITYTTFPPLIVPDGYPGVIVSLDMLVSGHVDH